MQGSDALVQWWYGHNAVAFFLRHLLGLCIILFQRRQIVLYILTDCQLFTLVFDFYLYLGWTASFIYSACLTGRKFGSCFFINVMRPSWGGDKWFINLACLG
jgi:cbb3-type cytochrome oxidase subunit 1